MPYKDKKKKAEKYLNRIGIYIRYDEPEVDSALRNATTEKELTQPQYAKQALIEKLTRDGYLKEPEQQD